MLKNQKKTQRAHLRELVALYLVPNLGAQRIRLLLQAFDHPQDIFRADREELQYIKGIGLSTAEDITSFNSWDETDKLIERTGKIGAELMTYWDDDYPPLLREIYDPPMLLWIKGNRKVLRNDSIAIVGTRKAGKYGRKMAREFAAGLAAAGITVVSGLALGIDGAAHKSTVEAGGCTIAVLGSGIDNIYPNSHKQLNRDIIESGGAVISEFPLGTKPDAGNFPVRNRIVSGLSLGTLVVESGLKGGSMITARSAIDQNREVFVIPHPLNQPNSEGCNSLIKRSMGKLVENIEDILIEIEVHLNSIPEQHTVAKKKNWKSKDLDSLSTSICEVLEEGPLHIDSLAEELGVRTPKLLSKLLELEMQECIKQNAGKEFELV